MRIGQRKFLARGLDVTATDVHGKLDLVKIPDRRTTVARPGNLPEANWLHLEEGGVQCRLQAKRQVLGRAISRLEFCQCPKLGTGSPAIGV